MFHSHCGNYRVQGSNGIYQILELQKGELVSDRHYRKVAALRAKSARAALTEYLNREEEY